MNRRVLSTAGLAAIAGLGMFLLLVSGLRNYGLSLFMALPFSIGLLSSVLGGWAGYSGFRPAFLSALLALLGMGVGVLVLRWEGLICLLMAAPLVIVLAVVGVLFGQLLMRPARRTGAVAVLLSAALATTPVTAAVEKLAQPEPPVFPVISALDIAAPPEVVWRSLLSFPDMKPPTELMFRVGIAYPIRAEIDGEGVGVERRCVFSTGNSVEPITVWDPPRRLGFGVTAVPEPMREISPWGPLHTPHLRGYFASTKGEFLLIPLASGGTRLQGTTWYRHGLWPASYWKWWSDEVLHAIHMRVLREIKARAENRP